MSRSRLSQARKEAALAAKHQISYVPIGQLRPNPRNARNHSNRQIEQLVKAFEQFDIVVPVIVDADNIILSGHGRVEALKRLCRTHAPVIRVDHLSPAAKRAFALAENKIAQNAGWDREALALELGELCELLVEEHINLDVTGFSPAELDGLASDFQIDPSEAGEELPLLPTNPVTRPQDLWIAGKHRVICGDAREASVYQRLLGAERAEMVFTDPPYNVPISGHVGGRGRTKHREFAVASGEMSSPQFQGFLEQVLGHCARYSADGSIHFVCMDWRHMAELQAAGSKVYPALKNVCVWVKSNAGQGSFYRSQHEFIFVFKSGDGSHVNNFELGQHGRTRTNVWNYAGVNAFRAGRMDELQMHPTVKPISLVVDAIKDCSKRGSGVLDAFLGSGTTLVAAEQTGRRAFGIELDPAYVDVAIERWQRLSGCDAILEGTSLTFDQLRADPSLRSLRPAAKRRANGGRVQK
jgi:DNA modification methylase